MAKWQLVATLLLVGLLALGGCAPQATHTPPATTPGAAASQAPSQWDKVMAAAKREGKVTIYMGMGADVQQAIMEGMKKAAGITAEITGIESGIIKEKVRMERQVGAHIVDLYMGGLSEPLWVARNGYAQGITVILPEAENKAAFRVHPYSLDLQKKETILLQNTVSPSVLINTNLVKPGEEPQSWFDLLDPKWKGKIIVRDPRTPGPTNGSYPAWKTLGEDYWRKLVSTQDVLLESKSGRLTDAVVLGEKAINIFPSHTRCETAIEAGAPIKFLHMKEGSHVTQKGACIIKDGPHPNAALVLMNWLMSKEGQIAIGKADGRITLRTDVNHDWIHIKEFLPGAEKKAFEQVVNTDEQQAEVMEFFTKLIGKR